MISGAQALRKILRAVPLLAVESVRLPKAAGRVLARPLRARIAAPLFDNSTMDGFAVRARGPRRLKIRALVAAGSAPGAPLRSGEAFRVMTGAPIPRGADAVVAQEQALHDGNGAVELLHRPEPGDWIRRAGEDVRRGELLLRAGTRLRPYEVALLAAQGFTRVSVFRRPLVAVLSTGDELVSAGRGLGPGKIPDANGPAALAALGAWGIPALDLGIARDDAGSLRRKFSAARRADVLVVSGGVSVGDFDLTKPLLQELGLKVVFWKARIKPGKPLLFGLLPGGRPVFGLPGNPVSTLVCLEEFVLPALEKMQGLSPTDRYVERGTALNAFELPRERRQYLFCRVERGDKLRILKPQASHRLKACARADALALPPEGARRVRPGDCLPFRWLD